MCWTSALQDGELQQGMTADHLFPILQSETDSESLSRVASTLATRCGRRGSAGVAVGPDHSFEEARWWGPQGEGGGARRSSCQCCSLWDNIELRKQCKGGYVTVKSCSRSWTMCSWFAHPIELPMFWQYWHRSSNVTHINLHQGKTQVWNRGGEVPEGIEAITRAARALKPDAIVLSEEQEIMVLGAPIGLPAFVREHLVELFQEDPPHVEDAQACWLLLLMCAATRANFWLRMVRPEDTLAFAERHECLRAILASTCRCGRQLDVFGHHRGFWGRRGFALECAAAQVCREAGARVATNVFVRDLDLGEFNGLDGRRLEVIADGFPLWRGAQLAIDSSPQ